MGSAIDVCLRERKMDKYQFYSYAGFGVVKNGGIEIEMEAGHYEITRKIYVWFLVWLTRSDCFRRLTDEELTNGSN